MLGPPYPYTEKDAEFWLKLVKESKIPDDPWFVRDSQTERIVGGIGIKKEASDSEFMKPLKSTLEKHGLLKVKKISGLFRIEIDFEETGGKHRSGILVGG